MIRLATREDVKQLVPLIMLVLEDMDLDMLTIIPKETLSKIFEELVTHSTYRYSYKRALVYIENEQILGVAYSYPESDEATIDIPLNEIVSKYGYPDVRLFVDPETKVGEWYLDTIATKPEARGKGVGSALIEAVSLQATQKGYHKVGLNVDLENPKAKKLYERLGFCYVDQIMIGTHAYEHLQKEV